MSSSTSTPKKTRRKMKSVCEDSGEDSSNLLRSILGVSPVPDQGAKQGPRTPKETKQGARSTKEANQEVRSPKVPLRRRMNSKSQGQEMPAVCSLSLQEVIERVARPEPGGLAVGSHTPPARARSLSASEVPRPPVTPTLHCRPLRTRAGVSESGVSPPFLRTSITRSPTPESDAGYGTSFNSTPGSQDTSLAELVRMMKLRAGEDSSSGGRNKLPSISELDPAVSQAGRTQAPQYSHHHHPVAQGPNLLQTLFGGYPHPGYEQPHLVTPDPALYPHYDTRHQLNMFSDPYALERAAKLYRSAASVYEASCTWSGQLPSMGRSQGGPIVYSNKVFLGGVPWDITEKCLQAAFRHFGPVRIEWPGRGRAAEGGSAPKGYLYVILEGEGAVAALLAQCTHDYSGGGAWYYRISSRRTRSKDVQVIPWLLSDSNFVRSSSQRLDPNKTVFVGALHGMLNAEGLSQIFSDLFGSVVYAGIDTDRHKYPIGSGRVTFSNNKSYMKAVAAAFIQIKTPKFTKKVQVDPYLEDALCSSCLLKQGPYFCRDMTCFNYYCRHCWEVQHCSGLQHHAPIMRNTRAGGHVDRPVEPLMGLPSSASFRAY